MAAAGLQARRQCLSGRRRSGPCRSTRPRWCRRSTTAPPALRSRKRTGSARARRPRRSLVQHQNPEFCRAAAVVGGRGGRWTPLPKAAQRDWLLAYKDITSATNERTMIASFLPWAGIVNSAPLLFPGPNIEPRRECCLLANLNSLRLRLRRPAEGRQCAPQLLHRRATPRAAAGDLRRQVPLVEEGNAGALDQRAGVEAHLHGRGHASLGQGLRFPRARAATASISGRRPSGPKSAPNSTRPTSTSTASPATTPSTFSRRSPTRASLPDEKRGGQQFLCTPGSTGQMVLDALDRLAK